MAGPGAWPDQEEPLMDVLHPTALAAAVYPLNLPAISPGDVIAGAIFIAFVWLACRLVWPPMPEPEREPEEAPVPDLEHTTGGWR